MNIDAEEAEIKRGPEAEVLTLKLVFVHIVLSAFAGVVLEVAIVVVAVVVLTV